jgi:hypothetical protein
MRHEGTVVCTLIAEQVVCTKLAGFSSDLPGARRAGGLYSKTFVSVYNTNHLYRPGIS